MLVIGIARNNQHTYTGAIFDDAAGDVFTGVRFRLVLIPGVQEVWDELRLESGKAVNTAFTPGVVERLKGVARVSAHVLRKAELKNVSALIHVPDDIDWSLADISRAGCSLSLNLATLAPNG